MTVAEIACGVRLEPGGPLLFCYSDVGALERGLRVRVALGDDVREAVVVIAPGQIVAAAPLGDAPRVVDVAPDELVPDERGAEEVPAGIAFFPAAEDGVGVGDLRRALDLAAWPIAPTPSERRSPMRNQGGVCEGASIGAARAYATLPLSGNPPYAQPATVDRLEAGSPSGDGPIRTTPLEKTPRLRSADD